MTLAAGTRLGAYEIQSALGAGGMGEVYRARDPRLGRDVAIKVLADAFAHDPDRLQRFEKEARAVATLSHPNVLAIFDVRLRPEKGDEGPPMSFSYDVSPDGQRFLMVKGNAGTDPTSTPASLVVVLNWFEELKRLVPTK